jgi:hypothetical protein
MSLPRFGLEEDDDDSTAPAQFLLKLPPSYARRLSQISPPTPSEWMVPSPFVTPASSTSAKGWASPRLLAGLAGVAVALAILAGVGGALAQSSGGPVGISKHAPKKIEHVVRVPARQSGVAAHVHAVSTHAPQHHRAAHKR